MKERKEPVPGPVRNGTVTGLVPPAAAGVVATRGAGIAPGTGAENAVLKKGTGWSGKRRHSQPHSSEFASVSVRKMVCCLDHHLDLRVKGNASLFCQGHS